MKSLKGTCYVVNSSEDRGFAREARARGRKNKNHSNRDTNIASLLVPECFFSKKVCSILAEEAL